MNKEDKERLDNIVYEFADWADELHICICQNDFSKARAFIQALYENLNMINNLLENIERE